MDYLILLAAVILQAAAFVYQKKYQNKAGHSLLSGLVFNAILGFSTVWIFLGINGFRFEFSQYSLIMAFLMTTFAVCYNIISFKILKEGNMALYTLFLMTGGMTVPYIWGIAFLDESVTWQRTVGLLLIFAAVIFSNTGAKRPDKKQIALCVSVFVLNGFVSVVSKLHQIDTVHNAVNATGFVILTGAVKFIMSAAAIPVVKKRTGAELPKIKPVLHFIIISAAVTGGSYMLQLIGAENLPATVLYPIITGGCIIFTSIAGMFAFKERPTIQQWIGIAVCFAGICLFG